MKKKAIKVLEYSKIINRLMEKAGSEMTKNIISELMPYEDISMAVDGIEETGEAVTLIVHKGALPLGNFYDISGELARAGKGGSLTMGQLLRVRYNLEIAAKVVNFLKGDLPELPIHGAIAEVIYLFPELSRDIDRSIDSEDEMNDNASSELKSIRNQIAKQNDAIKTKMQQIIGGRANKDILQDDIVTVRDGRYVVPVKKEYKANVPGIVHDQSARGATLFIEPQSIVNLNNDLRELHIKEQVEIERILSELSSRVAEVGRMLSNNQELLVKLDFISAKGKLTCEMKGEKPELNKEGILELKKARHPLIDVEKSVPIDIRVGEDYRALIVTGPNTGGKTVTLKTAGLLTLMAETGLFIPALEGSRIPMTDMVFADIGDEQSIEQSLSTFSSHMTNIVSIVKHAGENSLVLLDELGAGTDPTEGAALAVVILEELMAKGAKIIATTHYTELKKYAIATEGVENGSMEFDVETLSPTYRLLMGIPGKSNAFEISRKLGLREDITEKAKMLIEGGDIQFEEVLTEIEASRKDAENQRDEAIAMNIEMKQRVADFEKEKAKFEKEREKLIADAKKEAVKILEDAKEVSEEVKEELKELAKIESLGERNRRFDEGRKRIKDTAGKYKEKFIKEVNDNPVNISDIKVGDRVKVMSLGQNGEILALPDDKGEILVQVGIMKMRTTAEDLKLIEEGKRRQPAKSKANYGSMYRQKAHSISAEIDVRGQNMDDARVMVEKYIDDAVMAGLEKINIIHGRGEGVLKKGIRDILSKHRNVKSWRKGEYNEGGEGVSIVTIKR